MLWLGHGIRLAGAAELVDPLLDHLGIPALVSWAGKDLTAHPLVYGSAGIYGSKTANALLMEADFVLAIGTRLAIPQVGYDLDLIPAEGVIVDIDGAEATKYAPHFGGLVMDAGDFIRELLAGAWRGIDWGPRYPLDPLMEMYRYAEDYLSPYVFLRRLEEHLKPDQIIVTDSGTALLCAHQILRVRPPQRLITTTGLGEMGFGLPGAVGASFARNKGEVLCLATDGGMMLNLQELQTIAHHRLPVKIIVFANDGYGMIKATQKTLGHLRSAVDRKSGLSCPNFVRVARAFGIDADVCHTWKDFNAIVPHLWDSRYPFLLEVPIDPAFAAAKVPTIRRADGSLYTPPLDYEPVPA